MQANGDAAIITPNDDDGAITVANGVTIVYPDKISSPEALAFLLYHERLHFNQFTTAGVGDRLGKEEREKDAWTKTRAAVAVIYAHRDETAKSNALTHADKMIAESTRKAASETRLRSATFGWYNPDIHSPGAIRANADSVEFIDRAANDQLRTAVEAAQKEAHLSRERAEREAAAERRRREGPIAAPVVAERPPLPSGLGDANARALSRPLADVMHDAAVYACRWPNYLTEEMTSHIQAGARPGHLDAHRARLDGCALAVFDDLTALINGRYGEVIATPGWLKDLAYRHRNRPNRRAEPPAETAPPPSDSRGGSDCFRGDDPFGCQPRK
jgi:hypothetical protein